MKIGPTDFDDADFVGRAVSQETLKHQAENGIPAFHSPYRSTVPTFWHGGYRIRLTIPGLNQPWRHVYDTLRGHQMVKVHGRWARLTDGTYLAVQWTAHARHNLERKDHV